MLPAIRVEDLSKKYLLGASKSGYRTLRESITEAASAWWPRSRNRSNADRPQPFWALRDVSFEIKPGEVFGIIGRNGAGKSTLLKILSRIVEPTAGRAEIRGRVGSLLEVGTGFHPELTGRENIYLSGSILGMARKDIERRFDEIVAFAEIEQFLDTPVKRYSSGMYVRLGFAVAAHLEPEVLIVDEVLAVGDAQFQKKSLDRMKRVSEDGRTVLLVSHQLEMIHRLCHQVLRLDRGRLVDVGSAQDVIAKHLANGTRRLIPAQDLSLEESHRAGNGHARFAKLSCSNANGGWPHTNGPLVANITIWAQKALSVDSLALTICHRSGFKLVNADSVIKCRVMTLKPGANEFRLHLHQLNLNPGTYIIGLWLARTPGSVIDRIESAAEIEIIGNPAEVRLGPRASDDGAVASTFDLEQLS